MENLTPKRHIPSAIVGSKEVIDLMYTHNLIAKIVDLTGSKPSIHFTDAENLSLDPIPEDTEIIYGTWGIMKFDADLLDKLPHLKVVFYAAGTVKHFVSKAFWHKGIRLCHAAVANSIPVAEFTLASILLGQKSAFTLNQRKRWNHADLPIIGNFNAKVGLIGYGLVARYLRKLLRPFTLSVFVYDPFLNEEEAQREDITLASIDEIFSECTTVSLHAPNLESTHKMIKKEHFLKMKSGSTFINTARGEIIDEKGLCKVLQQRPDIQAIIDVTYPEPPTSDNPLFSLPNVFITPHIAGAMGGEWDRLVQHMVDESERFIDGIPLKYEIFEHQIATMA